MHRRFKLEMGEKVIRREQYANGRTMCYAVSNGRLKRFKTKRPMYEGSA